MNEIMNLVICSIVTRLSSRSMLKHTLLLALVRPAIAALLFSEDFSCASIGCNNTGQPTNYSRWRWSTTGSRQSRLHVREATGSPPRSGNEVYFDVTFCEPPEPNAQHLGCYRSELALQRSLQDSLVDWTAGLGSSERWFGFSNKLPANYTWD
jgi:hypothetical protein